MGNYFCKDKNINENTSAPQRNTTDVKDTIDMLKNYDHKDVSPQTFDFKYATVIKVYDGDTITISAKHRGVMTSFRMRLYGVNCPELKGPTKQKGTEAKNFVSRLILNKVVRVEVLNNKIYDGKKVTEKYGRLIGNVYFGDDISENGGINLTSHIIENGHGAPYFGGKKDDEP